VKDIIKTDLAPAALGPYSQAIKIRGTTTVFCSGQIGLDPQSGSLVAGSAAEQARRVMENLKAVVEAAGAHMSDIVKTTMYLTDINDFAAVNDVYATYFTANPPARATVEVSRLPKGAKVEIDATAVLP
jgi:2-iminobutanoate/2-iminopropanoate deaminase